MIYYRSLSHASCLLACSFAETPAIKASHLLLLYLLILSVSILLPSYSHLTLSPHQHPRHQPTASTRHHRTGTVHLPFSTSTPIPHHPSPHPILQTCLALQGPPVHLYQSTFISGDRQYPTRRAEPARRPTELTQLSGTRLWTIDSL